MKKSTKSGGLTLNAQPNILIVDGMNFMHRARSGFTLGEFAVLFNFFRNFRALVEQFSPTRIYFVLEGHPKQRYDALPSYKANRVIVGSDDDPVIAKKRSDLMAFFRQVDMAIELMVENFPVSVVRHPEYECDDTIYNLINNSSKITNWIVASTDSDFTQLLNKFDNVQVYNPITKQMVAKPEFDYVTWKSLRGDGSDNIPGLPGITDSVADLLASNPDSLKTLFKDSKLEEQFRLNHGLISFIQWKLDPSHGVDEGSGMTCSNPKRDWDAVAARFKEWEFNSILKEKSWKKFVDTFDALWGTNYSP